jgi:hypothetical protein
MVEVLGVGLLPYALGLVFGRVPGGDLVVGIFAGGKPLFEQLEGAARLLHVFGAVLGVLHLACVFVEISVLRVVVDVVLAADGWLGNARHALLGETTLVAGEIGVCSWMRDFLFALTFLGLLMNAGIRVRFGAEMNSGRSGIIGLSLNPRRIANGRFSKCLYA